MKPVQTLIASALLFPPLLQKFIDDTFARLFQSRQFCLDAPQILKPRPYPQLAVLDMKDQILAGLHAHFFAHGSRDNEASALAKSNALAFRWNPERSFPSSGLELRLRIFIKPSLSRSACHGLPRSRNVAYSKIMARFAIFSK
jgi:hypothetical protein